jgi:uncharacterized membrane protein
MNVNKKELIPISILVLMFLIGIYFFDKIPLNEKGLMIIHWNSKGEPDGYSTKFVGLILMPLITVGLYLLFFLIPTIAVYKQNVKDFYKEYMFKFKLILILFLFTIYLISIIANLGYQFNMRYFIIPAIAILFYYIGHIIKHTKRNFFIGIRTPWTLSNDRVWKKTHELGSITFRINALIFLLVVFLPRYSFLIFITSLLVNILSLFIYSYLLYREEEAKF